MKYRVLWIEDGAMNEISELAVPVMRSREYELVIAQTISEALDLMLNKDMFFNIIIVDIRIPLGDIKNIYSNIVLNSGKIANYGIILLNSLLAPDYKEGHAFKIDGIDNRYRDFRRYGILSVDSREEINSRIPSCLSKITYKQKTANDKPHVLLDLIEQVKVNIPN